MTSLLKRDKNSRGFTLIEILVVVAIVGILASVVLVSLNTTRVNARDTARVATIKEVQKALELYFSDTGYYPVQAIPANISVLSTALVPTYISEISYEMTGVSEPMYYRPAGQPTSYLIYVSKEKQTQETPVSYGCRTGVGPVVDLLYPTSPRC